MDIAVSKFDLSRANDYERQCRIGLAGYDACHELAACLLSSHLGAGTPRHVLVVGAGGTAQEVQVAAAMEPSWRFTAVDPSRPMLEQAAARIQATTRSTLRDCREFICLHKRTGLHEGVGPAVAHVRRV